MPSEMKRINPSKLFYFLSTDYPGRAAGGAWRPNVDICETDNQVVVALEVPGVAPEDIEIIQHRDRLVVRGVRRPVVGGKARRFQQIEILCGEFEKEIILADELKGAPVEATLAMGILYLTIDKTAGAKEPARRQIKIEAQ